MVEKRIINRIIENILNDLKVKCGPTIAEMHTQLDGMPYRDMMKRLHEEDLFKTIFEWRYFGDLVEDLEMYGYRSELSDEDKEDIKIIKEELFQMGRRLIEGKPEKNEVPVIDKSKYHEDTQYTDVYEKDSPLRTDNGELEQKQIDAQTNIFHKKSDITVEDDTWGVHTKFESIYDERVSMNSFFSGDSSHLNRDIYTKKCLKELDNAQKSRIKNIDKLMNKSPGLLQDTVLYRKGTFDVHLQEGDHGIWKGYTSTSFQRAISEEYYGGGRFDVMFVIHAPKGTKGIVGNDRNNFKNGFMEHEYTLPRNTSYTILSFDPDNRICEIVLDEE